MPPELREVEPIRAASLAMVRALAVLVERLSMQDASPATVTSAGERRDAVRDALRSLAASARAGALQCHVDEAGLHVNELLVVPAEIRAEPALLGLARRLVSHEVGTLSIRQGAAPGELLTLGRLLAEPRPAAAEGVEVTNAKRGTGASSANGSTASGTPNNSSAPTDSVGNRAAANAAPGTVTAEDVGDDSARRTPTEVLRTWSVLVTPASSALFEENALSPTVGGAVARLRSARTDAVAQDAVQRMLELAVDAVERVDASSVEAIALALASHARAIGPGEGRLAVEGGMRRLLTEPVIDMLASRIPESADRDALVAVLARTGEAGGKALVAQLMGADDRPVRRAFFDAIVAQDSGRSQLREALTDSRWYVVRNAAALLGEMGMAEADAPLIPLLAHLDERIRVAAARALTRLRTARGLSALQQKLGDSNAEVRRLAAASFGLAGKIPGMAKPGSAALAAALGNETDEDVALEMIASMGKLASSDAVQRLIRMATDTSEKTMSRPWFRVATLDALVEARGHAAAPTLEVLTGDSNEEVARAARRLLETVLRGDR